MTGARESAESIAERAQLRAEVHGWWICECGRALCEHSRRKVPNAGVDEYICADTKSGRFETTLSGFTYEPGKGLSRS